MEVTGLKRPEVQKRRGLKTRAQSDGRNSPVVPSGGTEAAVQLENLLSILTSALNPKQTLPCSWLQVTLKHHEAFVTCFRQQIPRKQKILLRNLPIMDKMSHNFVQWVLLFPRHTSLWWGHSNYEKQKYKEKVIYFMGFDDSRPSMCFSFIVCVDVTRTRQQIPSFSDCSSLKRHFQRWL